MDKVPRHARQRTAAEPGRYPCQRSLRKDCPHSRQVISQFHPGADAEFEAAILDGVKYGRALALRLRLETARVVELLCDTPRGVNDPLASRDSRFPDISYSFVRFPKMAQRHSSLRPLTVISVTAGLLMVCSSCGFAAESVGIHASAPTIEEAIDVAKRCILERNVHVVGSFIESARYVRESDLGEQPHWIITWAHSREIKGGQVYVSVDHSRTCKVTFGR